MAGRSRRAKRIDLNKADVNELANISGIGKGKAIEIIDRREALGGFQCVEDLISIRGISETFIDSNKDLLYCSSSPKTTLKSKTGNSREDRSISRRTLRSRFSDSELQSEEMGMSKRKMDDKSVPYVSDKRICGKVGSDSSDGISTLEIHHTSTMSCPPEVESWLQVFNTWAQDQKKRALDELMERCNPPIIRHVMSSIEPRFQRDFISLLPKELAIFVLGFLSPKDLVQAAQTCKYWRILCDDNL